MKYQTTNKIKRKLFSLTTIILTFSLLLISGCNSSSSSTNSNEKKNGSDKSKTIRILEAGGPSGDYFEKGYIEPFTKETGIKVVRENPLDFGKLKAQVESKQQTYDLFELPSSELYLAMNLDLVEKLDWDLINPDPINEEAQLPYGIGYQYYSTIMAWSGKTGKEMSSWADFWDVKKFPGKRALPDFAVFALPIALLADGVPKDKLYPLDVDRAFKSLEKIKDHISVWWSSGSQPAQLLKDGEVDYTATWSGRVVGNTDNIKYTYNEGLLDLSYMVIPKGSKKTKEISELLHEMTVAENQVRALEVLPYTGPSKELNSLLPEDKLDELPTTSVNYEKQSLTDPEWWFENGKEVEERWQLFKLNLKK